MKKRRTLIISLLLVAALALGIGYAAVSGSLIIDGKVVTTAQPFNMHFIKFEAHDGSGVLTNVPVIACDTALSETSGAKTVFLNVRDMASEGDTVSATLTIRNDNDCDMNVSVEAIKYGTTAGDVSSDTNEYFEVITDWGSETKVVKATDGNNTATIKVTVTMKKSCTTENSGFFRIALKGESAV